MFYAEVHILFQLYIVFHTAIYGSIHFIYDLLMCRNTLLYFVLKLNTIRQKITAEQIS